MNQHTSTSFPASSKAEQSRDPVVAIVAGEPSGDKLAAGLIEALRQRRPDLHFSGIGGPRMEAAGCEILYDMDRIGVMGVDGLKDKLLDILSIRRDIGKRWTRQRPRVFVGVDVPDFNLSLEVKLKHAGVPCLHYVSPTVWAWRSYRIHKIRRAVSRMLTLFPFEADYYHRHNVPATCVGHPIADEITAPDPLAARSQAGLDATVGTPGHELIALLPGSRRSEVEKLAWPMVAAARQLYAQHPGLSFIIPFANDRVRAVFDQEAGPLHDLPVVILDGQARLALEASNLAIVASGTASLEAALMRVPHVVVYRISAMSYWLMRRLRQVDHYAMPNHLLASPEVPELIQDDATADNMTAAINGFLGNPDSTRELREKFAAIHASLSLGADQRAADAVAEYLDPVDG